MQAKTFKPGDKVTADYKSGLYAGEVYEVLETKAKVRVLAVLRHPVQGDLHHPHDADVPFFHQRKALAEREIAVVPLSAIEHYDGELPDYRTSLLDAYFMEVERMRSLNTPWSRKALAELEKLHSEYN